MAQKGMKLYTYKDNPRAKKILIAAEYTGVKLEFPPFEMGKDNKTEDFLWMNPIGKVPVLDTNQGFIFESNAIARYIARQDKSKNLLGRNDLEASQVDQWLDFCTNEVEPSMMAWLGPILGYIAFDHEINKQAVENIKAALKALNFYLETHTFLVGERVTLADIVVAATLVPLYQKVLEPRLRTPYPCVNRWFETMCQQEHFSKVISLDSTGWCTVAQKPTKFAEKAPKEKVPKEEREKKPKEEKEKKPKEDKPPKEEKEKPAKKEKESKPKDEEEEEDDTPKEEKKPNPLDALPKSPFQLDEFKREYSNKPVDVSSDFLFKNFDPEGYTAWWCSYKYNEENTVVFRTANLIGGFYQRMERMHKYAFGQMLVVGEENKHEIVGFWLIRGKEIPAHMVEEVPDTELYDWVPIDWANVEPLKPKIKAFLAWEAVEGKPCLDGKTFK